MRRFRWRKGAVSVRLQPAEVAILTRLPSLLGSVGSPHRDPAAARLAPPAYREDEVAAQEFARLTGDDLAAARRDDLARFSDQLDRAAEGVRLSPEDAAAWVRVLGDARLVLAARSGIDQVDSLDDVPRGAPDLMLIQLLGMFQGELTEALLAAMGPR